MLERMPKSVQSSFTDEQLMHIRNAVGARNWGNHSVDCRGVVSVPMSSWRYYFVFLVGRNRRRLSDTEKQLSLWMGALFTLAILSLFTLAVILVLYLLKSALGIDIFPNFSFGIWTWFKHNVF
ncbi:3-phosphoshikimate 1-carboxyvinyltransferase [Vibrio viridaestus]|uniref:3-phosphoshikimate 1-carboxyvinyltransferase n=2 Tax=Vibrio viridaestus TaxID=2487322 RepID=A0A3N9TEZ6_9VIBR|nr:3-phosphoshikimate 1-carboxyvinyltransferase [Vibrio viridaestus]